MSWLVVLTALRMLISTLCWFILRKVFIIVYWMLLIIQMLQLLLDSYHCCKINGIMRISHSLPAIFGLNSCQFCFLEEWWKSFLQCCQMHDKVSVGARSSQMYIKDSVDYCCMDLFKAYHQICQSIFQFQCCQPIMVCSWL